MFNVQGVPCYLAVRHNLRNVAQQKEPKWVLHYSTGHV